MAHPDYHMRETDDGLEVRLHVQPRAKRCEIAGEYNGAIKIKITAPPVDDAANRAVMEYLAGRLGISKSRITLLSGGRSRDKTVLVRGMSSETLLERLAR